MFQAFSNTFFGSAARDNAMRANQERELYHQIIRPAVRDTIVPAPITIGTPGTNKVLREPAATLAPFPGYVERQKIPMRYYKEQYDAAVRRTQGPSQAIFVSYGGKRL